MQHGDARVEAAHELHVVLDDDHGARPRERQHQRRRRLGLAIGHAGDRLVEQEQPLVLDQQHADLQPLLLAVAQGAGDAALASGEADGADHLGDHVALRTGKLGEEGTADAARPGLRQFEVLEHG